jgi:WD40 repeat protein
MTGECKHTIPKNEENSDYCNCVSFSPNGAVFLGGFEIFSALQLWDATSHDSLRIFHGHTGGVTTCCFDKTGRIVLSASKDKTIKLWHVDTGQCFNTLIGHCGSIFAACFSNSGNEIISASPDGKMLALWKTKTGALIRIVDHGSPARCCSFSSDGKLVAGVNDGHLVLWRHP